MDELIDVGQVVNTHGLRGEVRIIPWCDKPEDFLGYRHFYMDEKTVELTELRIHKSFILARVGGCTDVGSAILLKEKLLSVPRGDIPLVEGQYLVRDLIGLTVRDISDGRELGQIKEVLTLPANDVYVVSGAHEFMIPSVGEFVKNVDLDAGIMDIFVIDGMIQDAN